MKAFKVKGNEGIGIIESGIFTKTQEDYVIIRHDSGLMETGI